MSELKQCDITFHSIFLYKSGQYDYVQSEHFVDGKNNIIVIKSINISVENPMS